MGNPVKRLTQILVIAALALATLPTMAVVVDTTGSYGITRTNFPETVPTEIVALDLTGKTLANGTLEVIEVITPDGPDREWVEFIFSTPQRAPLANFFDQLWQVDILGIPTVAPSAIDGLIAYFTVDGVALDPIAPFDHDGFRTILPNPIPGAPVHDVWGGYSRLSVPYLAAISICSPSWPRTTPCPC